MHPRKCSCGLELATVKWPSGRMSGHSFFECDGARSDRNALRGQLNSRRWSFTTLPITTCTCLGPVHAARVRRVVHSSYGPLHQALSDGAHELRLAAMLDSRFTDPMVRQSNSAGLTGQRVHSRGIFHKHPSRWQLCHQCLKLHQTGYGRARADTCYGRYTGDFAGEADWKADGLGGAAGCGKRSLADPL